MNRLLKIFLYSVVLFFLFLWISSILKSCGSDHKKTTDAINENIESVEDNYAEDDFFEDEFDSEGTEDKGSFEESVDSKGTIDYTELDNLVEEKKNQKPSQTYNPTTENTQNTTRPSSTSTRSSQGNVNDKYMVIAGSYLIKDNAERMRKRLVKLGYSNASIVVFDLSQYHSVVANRFSTYDQALKASNELKRSGIDCYVHSQQF